MVQSVVNCVFCNKESQDLERHFGVHNEEKVLKYHVYGRWSCTTIHFTQLFTTTLQGRVYSLQHVPKGYKCPFEGCNFVGLPGELFKHGELHIKKVSIHCSLRNVGV